MYDGVENILYMSTALSINIRKYETLLNWELDRLSEKLSSEDK